MVINIIHFNKETILSPNVSCIGLFDGVHLGHKALIDETVKMANDLGLSANLITFDPDPDCFISRDPKVSITSLEERIKLFEKYGIENVIIIEFNEEIMAMSPNEFEDQYLKKLNIKELICGEDFSYGYKAKGTPESLKKKFKLKIIEPILYENEKISSTRIRQALALKDYSLVDVLLGYKYDHE